MVDQNNIVYLFRYIIFLVMFKNLTHIVNFNFHFFWDIQYIDVLFSARQYLVSLIYVSRLGFSHVCVGLARNLSVFHRFIDWSLMIVLCFLQYKDLFSGSKYEPVLCCWHGLRCSSNRHMLVSVSKFRRCCF